MKQITINVPDGKNAEWVNGVLTLVDDKPQDITERIKTFEDAIKELGERHKFVVEYNRLIFADGTLSADVVAFLKLRIICAALNEGWEPQFTEDEERWYPWHWLYTQKEIDEKDEEEKTDRRMMSAGDFQTEYAGFAYTRSSYSPSGTNTDFCSRLCLKSDTLAAYCGKQFIDLWADFKLIRNEQHTEI